ncbi:MAG: tetratricopeptide repeat protein [Candidatus Promineifilaceae bacterium]|nr:tetratricopeptide repeat protein [Candidatus Promineifilaceae bacterium]
MAQLPTGTLTFLFTDIEGSTRLWQEQPQGMQAALARHDQFLKETVAAHQGQVVKTTGDGMLAVFMVADDAVRAALSAQRDLEAESWGKEQPRLRVRMALHSGAAELRDGDYYGNTVNRAARLVAAGHGGQILISAATRMLIRDSLPAETALVDLGRHQLRDLLDPERIYQLTGTGLPARFPALRSLNAQPTNLPSQATPFVGRQQELAEVTGLLRRPEVRMVTVLGPGGSGKTRLAVQAAADLLSEFPDGVFFVDLSSVHDPHQVAAAIAEVLGVRQSGTQDYLTILRRTLGQRQLLLVLDNFEQLVSDVDALIVILDAAPDVAFLVTSRQALNLHEEWIYSLGGLEVPGDVDDDHAESYSAVQLFVESAQRVRSDFSLEDERRHVIRICQLVEGMPLALELAAAWVRTMGSATIADEIERNVSFLSSRMRNLPDRHRSIHAVFEESWQMLEPAERDVYKRLSVFHDGFQREAAEAVAGASLMVLTNLVDKSLLRWRAAGRYHMHSLLRQCAFEKLDESAAELADARDAHCHYYIDFLHQRQQRMYREGHARALEEIDDEVRNITAAWRWAVEQQMVSEIRKGNFVFNDYHDIRGKYIEGGATYDRVLEQLEGLADTTEVQKARAEVLVSYGWHLLRLGRLDEAQAAFQRSLDIYEGMDGELRSLFATDPITGLGVLANTRGEYELAEALSQRLRRRALERDDDLNLQVAYYTMASSAAARGRYEQAQEYAEQAYAVSKRAGSRWFQAYVLLELGHLARIRGELDQAWRYYEESLTIRREFDDPEGMALSLNYLGDTARHRGDLAEAKRLHRQSLSIYRKIGDQGGLARCLNGLAVDAKAGGDYDEAQRHLRQALAITFEMSYVPLTLAVLNSVGEWLVATNQAEQGIELLALIRAHEAANYELTAWADQQLREAARSLDEETVITAIRRGEGHTIVTATESVQQLLELPLALSPAIREQPLPEPLTEREQEVLALLAQGLTNPQIAERLVIAVGTVKSYTSEIYGKLDVGNRTEAAARARELGILE